MAYSAINCKAKGEKECFLNEFFCSSCLFVLMCAKKCINLHSLLDNYTFKNEYD